MKKCILKGVTLTQEEFYEKLKKDELISTSQPSPADLCDLWDKLLRDYEEIVHIPMSSGLSHPVLLQWDLLLIIMVVFR